MNLSCFFLLFCDFDVQLLPLKGRIDLRLVLNSVDLLTNLLLDIPHRCQDFFRNVIRMSFDKFIYTFLTSFQSI